MAFVGSDGRPGTLLRKRRSAGACSPGRAASRPARWNCGSPRASAPAGGPAVGRGPALGPPRLLWRALVREPGLTLSALSWRLQGKKVRARGFLDRALRNRRESGYAHWIRANRRQGPERAAIAAEIAGWSDPPTISVLMPVYNPSPRVLSAALASLQAQLYPHGNSAPSTTPPPTPR